MDRNPPHHRPAHPAAKDVTAEIERRLTASICSGCARARKPVDLWCWCCLLAADDAHRALNVLT